MFRRGKRGRERAAASFDGTTQPQLFSRPRNHRSIGKRALASCRVSCQVVSGSIVRGLRVASRGSSWSF